MSRRQLSQPRGSSPIRSGYRQSSSPDPLTDPNHLHTAERASTMAAGNVSPARRRSFRVASGKNISTSPKIIIAEQSLSPWKIKVTLEAENEGVPPRNTVERYTTSNVKGPLKDAEPRMGPARRRSVKEDSTIPDQGPISKNRRQSATDLTARPLGDGEDSNECTGALRSTKKRSSSHRVSGRNVERANVRADDDAGQAQDIDLDKVPKLKILDTNTLGITAVQSENTQAQKAQYESDQNHAKATIAYPTPSPTASSYDRGDVEDVHDTIGFDTVMESEGFTMIDLNSLASARHVTQYPVLPTISQQILDAQTRNDSQLDQISCNPAIDVTLDTTQLSNFTDVTTSDSTDAKKKYRIGHLQLPSSTNVQRNRLVTPMPKTDDPYSSSSLPSSPPAIHPPTHDRPPVQSEQVVRAGTVLHDALSPSHLENRRDLPPVDQEDKSGAKATRLELGAELNFGEQLKKHESKSFHLNESLRTESADQLRSGSEHHVHQPNADLTRSAQSEASAWQQRIRENKNATIQKANSTEAIVVQSDDELGGDGEDTMGDIWLSEARKTSSSPQPTQDVFTKAEHLLQMDEARRAQLPSPWRRGQQPERTPAVNEETVSGLYWQDCSSSSSNGRFGGAIVAKPDWALPQRGNGRQFHDEHSAMAAPPQLGTQGQNLDEPVPNTHFLAWRNAEEVIDEDTVAIEGADRNDRTEADYAATRLCDTKLEAVQDISSSPEISARAYDTRAYADHDSTYSSISDDDSTEAYKQRIDLSPSKQRPATPRSALKGGRASLGVGLPLLSFDNGQSRKVVWARKSKCVNEEWEESTRSIVSSQESGYESSDLEKPSRQQQGLEATFRVDAQPLAHRTAGTNGDHHAVFQGYQPSLASDAEAKAAKMKTGPGFENPTKGVTSVDNHSLPSYLLAPSYPSDPNRNIAMSMSTSGHFTNAHFRTLHIIYRKSMKPRFHAPTYPAEIRPSLLKLVNEQWKLTVDESNSMGEDGIFEFTVGGTEARVLERFMQEIELPYIHESTTIKWGWSVQELAERLARIAIGETVRDEERAVDKIMRSAKKLR